MDIIRQGKAQLVVMFYEVLEPVAIQDVDVEVYSNGMVNLKTEYEELTTTLNRLEIVWTMKVDEELTPEQDKDNAKLVHMRRKNSKKEDDNGLH